MITLQRNLLEYLISMKCIYQYLMTTGVILVSKKELKDIIDFD